MTAILRIQKINFGDKYLDSRLVRGIDNGGLIALHKHHTRTDINVRLEMKSKQATNIDETKSHNNVYFETLTYKDIDTLKRREHRTNSVGAFEMVFDFQDLTEEENKNFDIHKHKELIDNFIKEQSDLKGFKLLSYVFHADEKNNHFHLTFSGWNDSYNSFNFNEVFNPKIQGDPLLDKNGNNIYKKHNRGKLKGQEMLDEFGNKLKKFNTTRENGTQKLQDNWGNYLKTNSKRYSHKKDFTSVLQYSKGIWRKLDNTTKDKIFFIREMEKERIQALREENLELVLNIEEIMKTAVFEVMSITNDIQADQAIHRIKKPKKVINKLINTIAKEIKK